MQLASNRDIIAYSINLAILPTLYTASLALSWPYRVLIPQEHSWRTEAGAAMPKHGLSESRDESSTVSHVHEGTYAGHTVLKHMLL